MKYLLLDIHIYIYIYPIKVEYFLNTAETNYHCLWNAILSIVYHRVVLNEQNGEVGLHQNYLLENRSFLRNENYHARKAAISALLQTLGG